MSRLWLMLTGAYVCGNNTFGITLKIKYVLHVSVYWRNSDKLWAPFEQCKIVVDLSVHQGIIL